jgi:hypothetical protein
MLAECRVGLASRVGGVCKRSSASNSGVEEQKGNEANFYWLLFMSQLKQGLVMRQAMSHHRLMERFMLL